MTYKIPPQSNKGKTLNINFPFTMNGCVNKLLNQEVQLPC